MLSIVANGKTAWPLRACPFLTAGAIEARSICSFTDDQQPDEYGPLLDAYRLTGAGSLVKIRPGELARMRSDVLDAVRRGSSDSELRAYIPAAVFVLETDLRAAYVFIQDEMRAMNGPEGPVVDGWSTFPIGVTPEDELFVSAGINAGLPAFKAGSNPTPAPRLASSHQPLRGRPSLSNRDLAMCAKARELAPKLASEGKFPKKDVVVQIIASNFGVSTERASRVLNAAGVNWGEQQAESSIVKALQKAKKSENTTPF